MAWVAATAIAAAPLFAGAAPFVADPSSGTIVIHAAKKGLLSSFAHDHRLVAVRWRTEIAYDDTEGSGTLEVLVVVDAGSLHETSPRLGESSRATVDREVASADVLDARSYPEIRVHATGVLAPPRSGEAREGELRADLTLHGTTRPVVVPFRVESSGDGYRAKGSASFLQTQFGMKPYSTAMGTIGVDDEIRIEFDLSLRPAVRPPGGAAAPVH